MNKRKSEEENGYPSKRTSDLNEGESQDEEESSQIDGKTNENEMGFCGIIESVVVQNFMCHAYLTIKLGKNVNFIIGKNGSKFVFSRTSSLVEPRTMVVHGGKSAILTAVVVGLGGTANNTNRGNSVKNFIQQGKQKAEITIKIHNFGAEAFKPNIYGDKIIVQRTIRSNGSSQYNIKDYSGKVVSNHKSDLNLILNYFNIQVDNPISILNQELSRQFLRNEDPKSKYKLFMKATQLEQVSRDLIEVDQERRAAKDNLENRKKTLPHLHSEVNGWKAKHHFFTSLEEFKQKQKLLQSELAWAQILGLENELETELNKVSRLKIHLEQKRKQVDSVENEKIDLESKSMKIMSDIEAIESRVTALKTLMQEQKLNLDGKNRDEQRLRSHLTQLEKKIQITTGDKQKLLALIKELETGEASKAEAAEKERRALEISNLITKSSDIEASRTTTQHHCDQLKISINKFAEESTILKNDERLLGNQLLSARRNLRDAENAVGDQQKRFGQWVPEVLSEIDKAFNKGIFRHKPRGPLGLFIKVKDPKWYLAMESCLQNCILAFTCDNKEDERKLDRILSTAINKFGKRMPSIIVSSFESQVHDVERNRVKIDKYPSALDLLEIDDPVVTNCLIDQLEIESILFIDNNDAAKQLMLHDPPRNCKETFTLEADKIYPAPRFRFYSGRNTRVNYFKDVGDNIAYYKNEMEKLDSQIQSLKLKIAKTDNLLSTNRQEYNKTDNSLMKMHSDLARIDRKLNELKNVEEPDFVAAAAYEEDLRIFTQQLENLNKNLDETNLSRQTVESEITALKKELTEIDEERRSKCNDELLPFKEHLILCKSDLGELKSKLQRGKEYLENLNASVEESETDCRLKRADIDNYIALANKTNLERPKTIRTEKDIENEMKAIAKHLERTQNTTETKDLVTSMYNQAKKKADMIDADINHIEKFLSQADIYIRNRRKKYDSFKYAVGLRVAQHFTSAYHRRNHGTGRINFDHKAETLSITVVQSNNGEVQSSQNMKSLSGGERSFSTVAFILALWEAIDSPFRMLDEFDVFMDMVNRKMSLSLLQDFANNHLQNQFMFLTPLEMTHIDASNKVRIFKMNDPERNQTVLPFRPVNETNEDDE